MLNAKHSGLAVRRCRQKRGITINGLARRIGYTFNAVQSVETGKHFPGSQLLYELARVFEVSMESLLEGTAE